MPFTPLHLGPALILGYFLKSRIHWPTLIVTSVVVDLEPLLVILLDLSNYPIHGYLHTFASAVFLGSLASLIMWLLRNHLNNLLKRLALMTETNYSLSSYVTAGIGGWVFHVLLDSPLYSDIKPLYPLSVNPFYSPGLIEVIASLCFYSTLLGFFIYLRHYYITQTQTP